MNSGMPEPVFERIRQLLDRTGVSYSCREHAPVFTSQEAADVRGATLAQGAKSLVLHVRMPKYDAMTGEVHEERRCYILAVLSAAKQANLQALRDHLGARKVALASPEEVLEMTGCTIGSVPPFGSILNLPTYVDPGLAENEIIAFNPGSHTHSILMRYEDYADLVDPKIVPFAMR